MPVEASLIPFRSVSSVLPLAVFVGIQVTSSSLLCTKEADHQDFFLGASTCKMQFFDVLDNRVQVTRPWVLVPSFVGLLLWETTLIGTCNEYVIQMINKYLWMQVDSIMMEENLQP